MAGVLVLVLLPARFFACQLGLGRLECFWGCHAGRQPQIVERVARGRCPRFEVGEFSAAGPYWSRMLEREPESGIALCLIALLEEVHGRKDEADRLFARAIVLEPGLVEPDRYSRYYGWRPCMRAALDSLLARAKI